MVELSVSWEPGVATAYEHGVVSMDWTCRISTDFFPLNHTHLSLHHSRQRNVHDFDLFVLPMIERHCDSTDTCNVHDVIHARGFIRSPSAQKMIQEFPNRKEPNRFTNTDEVVSLGVQDFLLLDVIPLVLETAGCVTTKLIQQCNVHDFRQAFFLSVSF